MTDSFAWPIPPGYRKQPVWTGCSFRIEQSEHTVLSYSAETSGWTDELTVLHEDHAGTDHFIDLASRKHTVREVRHQARGKSPVILEIGCSSGFCLRALQRQMPEAQLIGADSVREPLERLAQQMPGVPLVQFDLTRCPLPDRSVDVVVLLNVLEHIKDDRTAVRQIARILKPGGSLIMEVPAGPHLYDVYDKVLMHYRRYELGSLRRLLEEAGLSVVRASCLGALFYPGFWYVKRKNRRLLTAPSELQREVVAGAIRGTRSNRLFHMVMAVEGWLRRWIPFPFGIRCLATCIKPH